MINNRKITPELKKDINKLKKLGIYTFDSENYLYKYVSVETAKIILESGTLKFSTPNELKDKDCESYIVDIYMNNASLCKWKRKSAIKSMLEKGEKRTYIYEYLSTEKGRNFIKLVKDEQALGILKEQFLQTKNNIGFLCLTTSPNNEKMWNKFGQNGKGVCIEYKFSTLFSNSHRGLRVKYDNDMLKFNICDKNGEVDYLQFLRWCYTKSIEYEFEDEVRIISNIGQVGITQPVKEVFTGLYYGKETIQSDIDTLDEIVGKGGYSFKQGIRYNDRSMINRL